MRATLRVAFTATALGLAVPVGSMLAGTTVLAAPPEAPPVSQGEAKEVALTQQQIDGIVASQPEIQAIEAKVPQGAEDKPDPKVEASLNAVAKKNGFSSLGEYADVSSSIGVVLAGMDPETKKYVGPEAVIKKQMEEVKADKAMPPKEKKEALDELAAALQPAATAKPSEANVALVSKNFDKLNASMQQSGGGTE